MNMYETLSLAQLVIDDEMVAYVRRHRRGFAVDETSLALDTVREVERRLLENRGYEVVVAIDGMDGLNALQRASFDLLVTDVDMPRMSVPTNTRGATMPHTSKIVVSELEI